MKASLLYVCTHNHLPFHKHLSVATELSVKSTKEGRTRGFDPSLRKLSIKSSLACCALDPILKVGCNFWDLLFPPLKLWEKFRI